MLANMGFVNTILGDGRSNLHSWGGVGLCGPDRPTLVSDSCRSGRGTWEEQAGSGKWAEPVAVAHPGPEGAQGRPSQSAPATEAEGSTSQAAGKAEGVCQRCFSNAQGEEFVARRSSFWN